MCRGHVKVVIGVFLQASVNRVVDGEGVGAADRRSQRKPSGSSSTEAAQATARLSAAAAIAATESRIMCAAGAL